MSETQNMATNRTHAWRMDFRDKRDLQGEQSGGGTCKSRKPGWGCQDEGFCGSGRLSETSPLPVLRWGGDWIRVRGPGETGMPSARSSLCLKYGSAQDDATSSEVRLRSG